MNTNTHAHTFHNHVQATQLCEADTCNVQNTEKTILLAGLFSEIQVPNLVLV